MKVWVITDTHFNHEKLKTYCQRPDNFTDLIIKNWNQVVGSEDLVIHLGDVIIGDRRSWKGIRACLPGKIALVMGNHDRDHSATWWMENGMDFACQGMVFRNIWLTHEPSNALAPGCDWNVHGHIHTSEYYPPHKFNRLLKIEHDYRPVAFEKLLKVTEFKYQTKKPV